MGSMETACSQCKQPFEAAPTGRPRKFCSPNCRLIAHRKKMRATKGGFAPAELVDVDRWVGWRAVRRGDRWTKMPVALSGRAASSTDPSTWGSLADVRSRFGEKLGFVLGGGVGCIDLDDCFRGDGSLTNGAQFVLDSLGEGTWVEVSPSGRGLHVWGRLSERAGRVSKVWDQPVEVYSRGRYMTVTGDRWGKSPLVLGDLESVLVALRL